MSISSNFTLDTPFLLEGGTVSFIHEPTFLQSYVAEQLGVANGDISFTSASAESGANLFFQDTNYFGYDPVDTFEGIDNVTLTYTNAADGTTGTLGVSYKVVPTDNEFVDFSDGGTAALQPYGATYAPGVQRNSASITVEDPLYYGFDNYVSFDSLLETFTDTFGESATIKSIDSVNLAANGSTENSQIPFTTRGGYLTIDADDLGASEYYTPFQITNRKVFVRFTIEDDALGEVRLFAALDADPAPEGYVQPAPPSSLDNVVNTTDKLPDGFFGFQYAVSEDQLLEGLSSSDGFSVTDVQLKFGSLNVQEAVIDGTTWAARVPGGYTNATATFTVQDDFTGETRTFTRRADLGDGYQTAYESLIETAPELSSVVAGRLNFTAFDENNVARYTNDNTAGSTSPRTRYVTVFDVPEISTADRIVSSLDVSTAAEAAALTNSVPVYEIVGNPYQGGYLQLLNDFPGAELVLDAPVLDRDTYEYVYETVPTTNDSIVFSDALGDATVTREIYGQNGTVVTDETVDTDAVIPQYDETSVLVDGFLPAATTGDSNYTIAKAEIEGLFTDLDGDAIVADQFLFATAFDEATDTFVDAPVTYDAATETYSVDTTAFTAAGFDKFSFVANVQGGNYVPGTEPAGVNNDRVQAILEVDIASGPVVEQGVEGVDFLYSSNLAESRDNDRIVKRGEDAITGNYWINSRDSSQTDNLVDGQEYAMIMGRRGELTADLTADEIIGGLESGDFVATKSFTSYGGLVMSSAFEDGAIDSLVQSADPNQNNALTIGRIDASTGELLTGFSGALRNVSGLETWDNFSPERTLSGRNDNAYGDILAQQNEQTGGF